MKIKSITIYHGGGSIALVHCEDSVSLNEEDKIRKMLRNFYTQKSPDFARLALQVSGTMILFRIISNGKRSPGEEEIDEIMKAINCYPSDEKPKRSATKKGTAIRRHSLQTALV